MQREIPSHPSPPLDRELLEQIQQLAPAERLEVAKIFERWAEQIRRAAERLWN